MASSFDQLNPMFGTMAILEQWGRWAAEPFDLGLGYQSLLGNIIDRMVGTVLSAAPSITADEAMRIDAVVSRLKLRNEAVFEALFRYYVRRQSVNKISKGLHISREQVGGLLQCGIGWVDAALYENTPVMVFTA